MKTTHNLQFEATECKDLGDETERLLGRMNVSEHIRAFFKSIDNLNENIKVQLFKVGTCNGVWYSKDDEFRILFISNSKKGNGHFDDVLEWFEYSCKRNKTNLVFEEVINKRLMKHLTKWRGFTKRGNDCIKYFKINFI